MKNWIKLVLVAVAVFAVVAGTGFLFLPPDAFSTAPFSIAALVICWTVAYWFVYYRERRTPFDSGA